MKRNVIGLYLNSAVIISVKPQIIMATIGKKKTK